MGRTLFSILVFKNHKMSDKSSVKLPEFIEDSPQTWWLTCEAVFETEKVVKDIHRYYHLVAALLAAVTRKLLDVLTYKGEEADRLALLKTRLMELFAPSESESYTRMCGVPMLQPGQKPSALYAKLRALLPQNVDADVDSSYLFRMMFLTHLPKNIQSTCSRQETCL